jgi:hypothetical protein
MKSSLLLLGIVLLFSCNYKQDFTVQVKIENLSNIEYDSIRLYVYPDREITFYNLKPNKSVIKNFEYTNFEYKRGEALASGISVFKGDEFYITENGLIDVPFLHLKNNYEYYIYDNYATIKKDHKPENLPKKHKTSKFPVIYD